MRHRRLGIFGSALLVSAVLPSPLAAQSEKGPYARIAVLRPHDGKTVDFEAGYIRHLDFHRQARDTWAWYGWTVWAGERQRWFVYATFGHSAASLDNPVPPAEDERDNVANVTPHAEFAGTRSTNTCRAFAWHGRPSLTARVGCDGRARARIPRRRSRPRSARAIETSGRDLWYRMVAGGTAPRYVRLRPRPSLSTILDGRSEQALPDAVNALIAKTTIEILNLRPTMSYGLGR